MPPPYYMEGVMTTLYDAILQTAMFSGVCVSGVSTADPTGGKQATTLIDTDRHERWLFRWRYAFLFSPELSEVFQEE